MRSYILGICGTFYGLFGAVGQELGQIRFRAAMRVFIHR